MNYKGKKVFMGMITFVIMLSSIFFSTTKLEAASIAPSKVRCGVGIEYTRAFRINFPEKRCKVTDLKSNSKNLVVKQTYYNTGNYYNAAVSEITVYAKKAGTYKVTFNIKSSSGRKLGSKKTVTVYANGTGSVVSSVKIGKTTMPKTYTNVAYVDGITSGKLMLKLGDGYKIKKIRVGRYDANGNITYKPISNGQKLTLGSYGYSYYAENSYENDNFYTTQRNFFASTELEITYSDSYNGDKIGVTSYTIYRRATKWAR